MKNISLKYKLLALFLSLGLGSMIAISIYFYNKNKEAILQRTFEQLTSVRVVKKRQIETFFKDRIREIELVSRSEDIKKFLNFVPQKGFKKHQQYYFNYDKYLNQYLHSGGYYDRFFISDLKQNIVSGNVNGTHDSLLYFSILKTKQYPILKKLIQASLKNRQSIIADYTYEFTENNNPSIYISTPIVGDKGENIGVIILQISLKAINEIMLEKSSGSGLGNSGESYLVGNDFFMRSNSRFKKNSVLKTIVKTPASINALNGITGTKIVLDYRNIKVFSSYSPLVIQDLQWIILAEIDFDEAMIPVNRSGNDILYIGILMSFIIIGLSIFFSTNIIAPIVRLQKATQQVKKGNYNVEIQVSGNDEITVLVNAFNSMTKHIKNQTEILIEREERLRHFYEATQDGIFLYKSEKAILVNKALEKLTGYTEIELLEKKLSDIIQNNNSNDRYESLCKHKTGALFPVEIQENMIIYKNQNINACVIRDITKRKKIEKDLELERKKRISALFDGQEFERKRLARELHDGLGQEMIALKLLMESTNFEDSINIRKQYTTFKKEIDRLIAAVRQISYDLMPPVLSEFGIETAINQMCRNINDNSNTKILFDCNGKGFRLKDKMIMYLYRIVQEAVTNAIKHAQTDKIEVQLIEQEKSVLLIVEDFGIGFNAKSITTGNGLYNMRERVRILGGRLDIISDKNKGTLINIKIPK